MIVVVMLSSPPKKEACMSGISDINGFIDIKFAPRRNQNVQPDSSQEIQRLRKCLSECEETNASYAARIKSLEETLQSRCLIIIQTCSIQ